MKITVALIALLLLALSAQQMLARPAPSYSQAKAVSMPEFTQTEAEAWVNSPPKRISDYKGQVLLIDFWAFECWNCYRSFPWLNSLEKKFDESEFSIVGVHTPEFEREKDRSRLEAKIKQFKLHHPVMMDNDYAYWRAAGNRYWPTYYLLDKQGQLRNVFIGETHADTPQAKKIEQAIQALITENGGQR